MSLKDLAGYPWGLPHDQVLPVIPVDENGDVITGGGGAAGGLAGGEAYQSPGDFAAAYATGISLDLSGLPFPPLFEQFVQVAEYDGDNLIASYSVDDLDLDWTWSPAADASAGVLEIVSLDNVLAILNQAAYAYEAHRLLTLGGVHGAQDTANALTVTFPATTAAEAIALGSDLRTQYELHRATVAPAVHGVADATNTIASANPTTWATLVAFVNEFKNTTGFNAHIALTAGGEHGVADTANEITAANAGEFDAASTFVVQLRGPERDILDLLNDMSGLTIHKSPVDFAAVYASATTIAITGMAMDPDADDIRGVVEISSTGLVRMAYSRKQNRFTWAAGVAGAGVLTIVGASMQAGSSFVVFVAGPEHHTSAADTARTTATTVKQVQHIDAGGFPLMSLISMAQAGFVKLTNGTVGALLSAADTARAAADVVLSVQQLDATGKVPPAGDTAGNAPFAKPTDGTNDLAFQRADTAGAVATMTTPVKSLDETGKVAPAGEVNTNAPFVQLTDGTNDLLIPKPDVTSATGSGAISTTTAIAEAFRIVAVTCHFDSAPTTSEDFTVTLDAVDGAAYDTLIFAIDPGDIGVGDIVFVPDDGIVFEAGDEIAVAYTNTDTRTYGLRIVVEKI